MDSGDDGERARDEEEGVTRRRAVCGAAGLAVILTALVGTGAASVRAAEQGGTAGAALPKTDPDGRIPLSLEIALRRALAANPGLERARAEVGVATRRRGARSRYVLPRIGAAGGYIRNDQEVAFGGRRLLAGHPAPQRLEHAADRQPAGVRGPAREARLRPGEGRRALGGARRAHHRGPDPAPHGRGLPHRRRGRRAGEGGRADARPRPGPSASRRGTSSRPARRRASTSCGPSRR